MDSSRDSDAEGPSGGSESVADEAEDARSVVEGSDEVFVEVVGEVGDEGGSGGALGVASKALDQVVPRAWGVGGWGRRRANDSLGGRGCWRGVLEGWEVSTGARALPRGIEVVLLAADEGIRAILEKAVAGAHHGGSIWV